MPGPDLFEHLKGRDLHVRVLRVADPARPQPKDDRPDQPRPTHGANFETVTWGGVTYALTPQQRIIVAVLWRAWEDGHPFISGASLLERADSAQQKMSAVFRGSPAWGTLVVKGEIHGGPIDTYCLAPLAV